MLYIISYVFRNGRLNIIIFYLHRYIRIMPVLISVMIYCSSVESHMAHGPLWKFIVNSKKQQCRENYWMSFLFIQNYREVSKACPSESWYLATDMQLFILAPLLLYPIWRWRGRFIWLLPAISISSMTYMFWYFFTKKLKITELLK